MPLRVLRWSIVAAIGLNLASAQAFAQTEDVSVAPETLELARSLGMHPERDRARFAAELVRVLYTPLASRNPRLENQTRADVRAGARDAGSTLTVPVPLSAAVWSQAVFRRQVPAEQLLATIVGDRRSALLCYALAGVDEPTLEYFAREPAVLTRLYQDAPAAFGAFGASLRVSGGRVVPPGGEAAVALWESLLGQPVTQPERFILALYTAGDGRAAYLYDTISWVEPSRARFALGLWLPDTTARATRFAALAATIFGAFPEWRVDTLPFSRPIHDLAMLLTRIAVTPAGAPAAPASRTLWAEALEGTTQKPSPGGANGASDSTSLELIDAAWLMNVLCAGNMFARGERLDQFAFGQRLFAGAGEPASWPDAVVAVQAFREQRMLMLTLERMGISTPNIYASAARAGARAAELRGGRAFWSLAQMQGAIALVARLATSRTIDARAAGALVTSLSQVPLADGQYHGALATWFSREVLPRLPQASASPPASPATSRTVESRLIAGLAGPPPRGGGARLVWEGQTYRVDLAFAESRRLHSVREKQRSYSVDLALALGAVNELLKAARTTADLQQAVGQLVAIRTTFADELVRPAPDVVAPGVSSPPSAALGVDGLIEDLRAVRGVDPMRARAGPLVDMVLAETLLSMAYAVHLGDPSGTALLTRNIAMRHDFGLGRRDQQGGSRLTWAAPRQDFLPGVPWHVVGSVLGLDIALAPLALYRVSADRAADVPSLPSNERQAFAVGVAFMSHEALLDRDRDEVAAAIARGRQRVADLAAAREPVEHVIAPISLDGWRRRALHWTLANGAAGDVLTLFSLGELAAIGGGVRGVDLDAWGASGLQADGCLCVRFFMPDRWPLMSGRPQLGLLAAATPDLNLRVAVALSELRVPAALARTVLHAAILEFTEAAALSDGNDWMSLVRAAGAVQTERIEDYVAAAAAVDGALVPIADESVEADPR